MVSNRSSPHTVCSLRRSASHDPNVSHSPSFAPAMFMIMLFSISQGPIKELALLEPLVDCCDPDQVISNAASVINIGTCAHHLPIAPQLTHVSRLPAHSTHSRALSEHPLISLFGWLCVCVCRHLHGEEGGVGLQVQLPARDHQGRLPARHCRILQLRVLEDAHQALVRHITTAPRCALPFLSLPASSFHDIKFEILEALALHCLSALPSRRGGSNCRMRTILLLITSSHHHRSFATSRSAPLRAASAHLLRLSVASFCCFCCVRSSGSRLDPRASPRTGSKPFS